jgi:amino acid adenylation domain-containing protein
MTAVHDAAGIDARIGALSPTRRALLERILAERAVAVPRPGIGRRPPGAESLPLSYEQERLWFMDQLVPTREVFHVPVVLRLHGPLDHDALRTALHGLVRRHEVLRTVFDERDGRPVQVVRDDLPPAVEIVDVRAEADPGTRSEELATASVVAPFDLGTGPLLRAGVYRVADEEHLFVLTQHHIASDQWSLGVLLADLGALYAHARGEGPDLDPPALHYGDFACWQRSTLVRERLDGELEFWRDALDGSPERLELPTDRRRRALRTTRGRFRPVRFEPELVAGVRALARAEGATLHQTFLAAYAATLARHAGQDDIVVGVPLAGRSRSELQDVVGYFLNWLPVRIRLDGRPSFRDLLRRVRDGFGAAFAHQDLPFEMLVKELAPPRALGSTPIFQTSFSLRDGNAEPPRFPGVRVETAQLDGGATHYDLMAELWGEPDGSVVGYLPYNDELFDDATVGRIADRMAVLLAGAVAAPDVPVPALPLLTAADAAAAVVDLPAGTDPVGAALHDRFRAQAASRPDAVAVTCDGAALTYGELDERSDRLAAALAPRGAGPGSMVGICLERSTTLVVAVLGVLKSGAAYVPLDPDDAASRMAHQLAATGCVALVTTPDLHGSLPPGTPPTLDPDDLEPGCGPVPAPGTLSAEPAYVIHTSGSTGTPKGVVVTHENVLRLFRATGQVFETGADDVWTMFHSAAFDFSVWELWGALLHGGRLVVVPRWVVRAPDAFARLVIDEKVTVLSQTPSAFAQLSRLLPADDHVLRYVVFGGEALDPATLRPWFDAQTDRTVLVNMYGITETTVHVTHRTVARADADADVSPIGQALDDLGVYLLDAEQRPVPVGVVGELYVGGAGVARGYVGDPATTAARMVPDPFAGPPGARMYRSGDLARRLASGELVYCGRNDGQVKIRGHRVEIGEVQTALGRLPGVADAVVAVRDDGTGTRLVGYVVAADAAPPSVRAMRRGMLEAVPEWMVPSVFVAIDAVPLTRNGKIDRRALPDPRAGAAGPETPYVAPAEGTEQALAEIWAGLLGVPRVGADDDFFDRGGHSLLVVQLTSRIRDRLDREIAMAELFQHATLRGMAEALDRTVPPAGPAAPQDVVDALSEAEIDAMLAVLGEDG